MIVFPKCKINVGLNVVEKRSDGYHNIEGIFYPLDLCDVLEIIPHNKENGKLTMEFSGIEIAGSVEDNLCYKAYHFLHDKFDLPSVKLFLHKAIPMGAGLGGGSSDGASTLLVLNQLFDLKLSVDELKKQAEYLGSDCPFFIESKPSFVQGKGENLLTIKSVLKDLYVVVINPGIHINTAKSYSVLHPKKPKNKIIDIVGDEPIENWKNLIENDFEPYVFQQYPGVKAIKEKLYSQGALYASMSGSGSSIYGIFKDEIDLKSIFPMYFYWSGKL